MTTTRTLPAQDPSAIESAAAILKEGGLVAFPTDTVYGLGAHAFIPRAVRRIFAVKGRTAEKAIPMLLADPQDLPLVADSAGPVVEKLVARFWPGGLTIVLPKAPAVPDEVTAGGPTIAARMPNHPIALALIKRVGAPLATTSANRSGRPSPKTTAEVKAELDGLIDLILDGGRVPGGVESTVLDLTQPEPTILRRGAVSVAEIEDCLGRPVQE